MPASFQRFRPAKRRGYDTFVASFPDFFMHPDSTLPPAPTPPPLPGAVPPPATSAAPAAVTRGHGPSTALIVAAVVAFLFVVGGGTVFAILKLTPGAQTALERLRATSEQARRERTSNAGPRPASDVSASADGTERTERTRALLVETSKQISVADNERAATELAQKYIVANRNKTQAYETAANALNAAGNPLSLGLTTKEAINARRELVKNWIAANDDLARSLSAMETDIRTEMEKSPSTRDGAADAARTVARNAKIDQAIKLRDYDRQKGQKILATLDLLLSTWGQWKVEPSGLVRFNRKETLARFNELQKAITAADEARLALQREVSGGGTSNQPPATATNKPTGTR